MAGGMQMTWDDWNPYLGVDYRLVGLWLSSAFWAL